MVSTKQSEAATLASILTDATGLAFAAWQDGKHAHARHGARTPSDEQGLAFRADVARWHSGPEITVECTGLRQLVRVDGGAGSGWARRAGARLASAVAEAQHSWARNCAAVLEAGCPAVVLEAMLGRDVTYDRRRGPPGQRVEVPEAVRASPPRREQRPVAVVADAEHRVPWRPRESRMPAPQDRHEAGRRHREPVRDRASSLGRSAYLALAGAHQRLVAALEAGEVGTMLALDAAQLAVVVEL